jgi:hypothetical protein
MKEVTFTVNMLRTKWTSAREAPIVVVITGDKDHTLRFESDPYTRVVHLKDIVGKKFNELVSTSIMRQITHGMLEIKDLEREMGPIENILHMHGDILLLNEQGFWAEFEKWKVSGRPVACDTVGPQGPYQMEHGGQSFELTFDGHEIMPQIFAVDHEFAKDTTFLYDMKVSSLQEQFSTEKTLVENLVEKTYRKYCGWGDTTTILLDRLTYKVCKHRPVQWGVHSHWGSFIHFGNQLHCPREQREAKNAAALAAYGLDLEKW